MYYVVSFLNIKYNVIFKKKFNTLDELKDFLSKIRYSKKIVPVNEVDNYD